MKGPQVELTADLSWQKKKKFSSIQVNVDCPVGMTYLKEIKQNLQESRWEMLFTFGVNSSWKPIRLHLYNHQHSHKL